jgi:4-amino-4-deoxy-L-arabinose transferase-like glycosyltransferase
VFSALLAALRRARARLTEDLRADPYLAYILVLATLLASFWIWHRLPNFATRDERWRVLDPIMPLGRFIDDPSLGSIREGVTYWRSYGGTFYLYGLALLPVLVYVIVAGEGSALVAMSEYSNRSLWGDWQRVPAWIWTPTVLTARLVNVALAVGSVYVVYRIGTLVRDRATGRLAALLLSLTWGLVVLAHEAGEDVPALFFFLLATYLALRYVDSGSRRTFEAGCLCGGIAAGFKFTAGVAALLLGVAYLTRARRADAPFREAVVRPHLIAGGLSLGVLAIILSYPQVLVGDPAELAGRLGRGVSAKGEAHSWVKQPSWWWLTRGYLNGLGLPLAVAGVAGLGWAVTRVRETSPAGDLVRLSLVGVGVVLLVYSRWAYVRTHHLLVTFPLLVLLIAVGARRLATHRPAVARVLVAALLLSTGAYTAVGDLGYAAQGRDQAAGWLSTNAPPEATVETYVRDPQDTGVPHGVNIIKPGVPQEMAEMPERCPEYIVLNAHRALLYPASADWGWRADSFDDPDAAAYVRALLDEDEYPYAVAGRFGRRPTFLDGDPPPTWRELLGAGVQPRTIQYGDPQDLGGYQYTVVLERTGSCASG